MSYRHIENGDCADACIGSFVGMCPLSLVVTAGGLEAGHCGEVGYSVQNGKHSVIAGPCGSMTFSKYLMPDSARHVTEPETQPERRSQAVAASKFLGQSEPVISMEKPTYHGAVAFICVIALCCFSAHHRRVSQRSACKHFALFQRSSRQSGSSWTAVKLC